MERTVVIVGGSVAGVRTAQALRSEGFVGRVVLVGDEPEMPYDKPPLSKQFLLQEHDQDAVRLLTRDAAERDRIELCLGAAAVSLDTEQHQIQLADGRRLDYDVAVIATGASARRPPWTTSSGVHVMRTLRDSRALRADLEREGPVAVVGFGFIGAEVAASARTRGREVVAVDPLENPLGRLLGPEIGTAIADLHRRHGVVTRFGQGVEDICGTAGGLRVRLGDGSVLEAASAVVGIGVQPNTGWLAGSGLDVGNGVRADEHCRAAEVADVYVVGDVARWYHRRHGEHVRVEHWTHAVEQAVCVAHNIVHPDEPRAYEAVEYAWSDQYDWKVQVAGRPTACAHQVLVGEIGGDRPRCAALSAMPDGRLAGAAVLNWPKALVQLRRLLGTGGGHDEALARVRSLL